MGGEDAGGEEVCLFECCCGRGVGVGVECIREGREEGERVGGGEKNAPRAMKNLS